MPFAPVVVLLGTAMAILVADWFLPAARRGALGRVAAAGLWFSYFALLVTRGDPEQGAQLAFHGCLRFDGVTFLAHSAILAITFLLVLVSPPYLKDRRIALAEYYALMIFAAAAMMALAASNEMITLFLNLEILSFCLYILTGLERENLRSSEAAFKYFLTGSYAAAFLLFGLTILYGALGTTFFESMRESLALGEAAGPLNRPEFIVAGLAFIVVGFGFKLTLAPFHMYAPDVYAGAPTPVAGAIATGSKVAGFIAFFSLIRLFIGWEQMPPALPYMFYGITLLTIVVGNVGAVTQPNIKRLFAYSGVAHSGYTLVPIVAALGHPELLASAERAIIYYVGAYGLMTGLAFAVATTLGPEGEGSIKRYAGLAKRSPYLAATLTLALLSMAGVPVTVGFVGKVFLIGVALDAQLYALALFVVLASVVSAFYYLKVTVAMYMQESEEGAAEKIAVEVPNWFAITFASAGVLIFAFFPWWYLSS